MQPYNGVSKKIVAKKIADVRQTPKQLGAAKKRAKKK